MRNLGGRADTGQRPVFDYSGYVLGEWNVVNFTGYNWLGASVAMVAQLFVPFDAAVAVKKGFIQCFHGTGERGTNNTSQITASGTLGGCPNGVTANKATWPDFVLAMQEPDNSVVNLGNTYVSGLIALRTRNCYRSWLHQQAFAAIAPRLNLDANRLKLTGFSGGGDPLYCFATRYPDRWALVWGVEAAITAFYSIYPFNDALTTAQQWDRLGALLGGTTPGQVWIDQTGDDPNVPVAWTRQIAASSGFDAPFTAPYTTAPSYSPNPYVFTKDRFRYREFQTGGHDVTQSYTVAGIAALLAARK